MNKTESINQYLLIALAIHLFFLISLNATVSVNDITTIGETGMNIQMVVLEKSDEVFEKNLAAEVIRNKTNDSAKDQQVLLDNRKVGEKSKHTYDTYYGRIRKIIDSNKKYPLLAKQRKQEGSPKVTFTILKSGIVEDISVASSGHRLLDREARRMILLSSPFPKIPEVMGKNYLTLTVPINFKLSTD